MFVFKRRRGEKDGEGKKQRKKGRENILNYGNLIKAQYHLTWKKLVWVHSSYLNYHMVYLVLVSGLCKPRHSDL